MDATNERTERDTIEDLRAALRELDALRLSLTDPYLDKRRLVRTASGLVQRAVLDLLARAMDPQDDEPTTVARAA